MKERLAVNRGTRVIPEGLVQPWPVITEDDINAVVGVLRDAQMGAAPLWGASPPQTSALQREWADYIGVKHCLLTNSGTAGLHMAVAAAGVEPGDEVITSAFTFIASATAILHHNGIPIFVDIDPKTLNIDPQKIEEKITDRTKAIIPVHIHGLPADLDEVKAIAKKHNLVVIEDACQAHGAQYKGKRVGSIGEMGVFSLNGLKNLSAGGEGGLFVTDSDEYRDKANMVRTFGEVVQEGKKREYNAYGMGWMYRTVEMIAAFVRSQLKRLDEYNRIRVSNCEYLTKHLGKIKGIEPPFVPPDRTHVYFLYAVRLKPQELGLDIAPRKFRIAMEKALNAEGIPVGQWQTMPVPAQTLFRVKNGYGKGCPWTCGHYKGNVEYRAEDYPETCKLIDEYIRIGGIDIPRWHGGITPPGDIDLMSRYVDAFGKVFNNIDQVIALIKD